MKIENIPQYFYLEKIIDIDNVKLFRYYVKSTKWAADYKLENPNAEGITKTMKNTEYYENAKWMVDDDLQKSKKDIIKQ